MANYVTNRLSVTGNSRALDQFSAAVGSVSVPFDFCKIGEIIPCTWDERDGADGTFQRTGNELVYRFYSSWGSRPELVCDLSTKFPELVFELFYVDEGPEFAGVIRFRGGNKLGECILGSDGIGCFYVTPESKPEMFDEYSEEMLFDHFGLEEFLLAQARAGKKFNP